MAISHSLQDKGPRRLDVLRLLESAPTALLLVEEGGTIVYANVQAARLLGIGRANLQGANIRLFHAHPGQQERLERLVATLQANGGQMKNVPVELRRIGGANFLAELTWEETQFNGLPVKALWLTDISVQRATEDLLTQMFDWAPLPLMLCRLHDGLIQKANRRAAELFIQGQSGECRLADLVTPAAYQFFRNHLRGGGGFVDDFEVTARTAYGETYAGTLAGQLVAVGDERCLLVGITDITERKRAEETLSRFFEGAPLAMLLVRLRDKSLLRVNRRASELLSIRGGMEAGHHLEDYVGLSSQGEFLEELHRGGFVDGYEALLNTDYGESVWTILSGQVVIIDDERCVLIGITDITDRINAERLMRRAEEEAVRANQAKSVFLATMSHEIRTPMNGVLGMLDVLVTTPMTGEQDEMVGIIRNSAKTLQTIIDDILDLSKIEAGKLRLEKLPLVLRDIAESTAELMAARAAEKGVEVGWRVADTLPQAVFGDPTRLRQILLNLLGNAVKFTAQGWVVVRILPTGGGGGEDEGGGPLYLRFEVEDTGIGLSDEQKSRLFQPFSQADASTTRQFGGTGLGLSICRRLVALMGGGIGVDSVEGKGSVFWFEIPLEAVAEEPAPPPVALPGLRIVVADDLTESRESIASMLGRAGALVIPVADGNAAAALALQAEPIDLALVDTDGGFEALEEWLLPRLPAGRFLPLTSTRSNRLPHALQKPVRRAVLLRRVAAALGQPEPLAAPSADPHLQAVSQRIGRGAPSVAEALETGRLILVAEDNFTNRLVIGKQLARLGYACEMAEDGEQAWVMLQKKGYAVLLTDCSMPNLDGYGLTQRIRAAEQGGPVRLPIMALTAHALDGDAERCRQAGMDDYLSKPIALDKLAEMLDRWLPADRPAMTIAPLPAPLAAPLAAAVQDPAPVDLLALGELLGEDDPNSFREVLGSFLEGFLELLPRLRDALAAGDHLALRDAAHAAKGAARNACAPALAEILAQLESRARSKDPLPDLTDLVAGAERNFSLVKAFVAAC